MQTAGGEEGGHAADIMRRYDDANAKPSFALRKIILQGTRVCAASIGIIDQANESIYLRRYGDSDLTKNVLSR